MKKTCLILFSLAPFLGLSAQATADTNRSFVFEAIYQVDYRDYDQFSQFTGFNIEPKGSLLGAGLAFKLKLSNYLFRVFGYRNSLQLKYGSGNIDIGAAGIQLGYEYPLSDHWSLSALSGFNAETGQLNIMVDTLGTQATNLIPNVQQWNYRLAYWQSDFNISYWLGAQRPFILPQALSLGLSYGRAIKPSSIDFSGVGSRFDYGGKAFQDHWQFMFKMEWSLGKAASS